MMDEYIRTLQIKALKSDQGAAAELEKALAHRQAVTQSTQRFASDLRGQGKDVGYRKDGGIEFTLGDRPAATSYYVHSGNWWLKRGEAGGPGLFWLHRDEFTPEVQPSKFTPLETENLKAQHGDRVTYLPGDQKLEEVPRQPGTLYADVDPPDVIRPPRPSLTQVKQDAIADMESRIRRGQEPEKALTAAWSAVLGKYDSESFSEEDCIEVVRAMRNHINTDRPSPPTATPEQQAEDFRQWVRARHSGDYTPLGEPQPNPKKRKFRIMTQKEYRTRNDVPNYLDGETGENRSSRRRGILGLLRYPMYFALGLLAAFCLYRSGGVFITAFKKLGIDSLPAACATLPVFPLLGWILNTGCLTFASIIASVLAPITLIALTIGESLPVIAFLSPEGIRGMVDHLRFSRKSNHRLDYQDDDNKEIRFLVDRHNGISESTFRSIVIFGIICFAIEACIVFIGRGSGANLKDVLIDTFGFEACLTGIFVIRNWFRGKPQPEPIKYRG